MFCNSGVSCEKCVRKGTQERIAKTFYREKYGGGINNSIIYNLVEILILKRHLKPKTLCESRHRVNNKFQINNIYAFERRYLQ